jgi:phosphorylcholine metabolism protein LicD
MKYRSHYKIEGGLEHEFFTDTPIKSASSDGELIFSDKTKRQQSMVLEMMEFLLDITKKYKIKWFAICGTLLGAVRNQGIIPYDDDGDVGFLMSEYDKFMKLTHMDLHPQFEIIESECGFQLVQKKGYTYITHFDLMCMDSYDDPEKLVYAGPIYNGKPLYYGSKTLEKEWIYKRDIAKITYRKFEHLLIPTPKHPEEYLTHVYGPDCLTVYVPDTRNINGFHLHELYMSLVDARIRYDIATLAYSITVPLDKDKHILDSHIGLLISRIATIPIHMNNDLGKSCSMINDAMTKYIYSNMV